LTVVLALGVCLGVLALVLQQVVKLAGDLPRYEQTYKERVAALRGQAPSSLARAFEMFRALEREATLPRKKATSATASDAGQLAGTAEEKAGSAEEKEVIIPVEVHPMRPTLTEAIDLYVTPALMPLVRVGIVLLLTIFLLLGVDDLRDRLLRVAGRGNTRLTENAINEAGARVSGYLLMQFINNVIYGAAVGLGLWAIGLPGAALWALGAMLVRFIPYLGPWIGALAPILLSLGVFSDWLYPLLVVLLFVVLEIAFNNFIEPYLFGIGAGLSPIAVIVSLIFWGWMWDGVGLLVAVPLTACLVVAGRYLPPLEIFSILMSDNPSRRRAVMVEIPETAEVPISKPSRASGKYGVRSTAYQE
jgi:predicted PurR-regulated permease PerM